jgi:SAM-dependent methyltransferase
MESKVINDKFETIYALDPVKHRAEEAGRKGLASIRGSVPPIPFRDESVDAILISGTIEHLPDERGFIEDSVRCLKDGGRLYVSLPVEVGIGGLIRYLGKNFVAPNRDDSPDGIRRYFDYSLDELTKNTARHKHNAGHRYYNYTYALRDVRTLYSDVTVEGWPIDALGSLNLILFVVAKK